MALNDDELKYQNVIKTLKGLPQVNVPRNFDSELMRRVNSETLEEKKTFWERLFLPSRLIPSAALAISAVILLFVLNINSDTDDPLLMLPKIREDVANMDNSLVVYLPLNFNKIRQKLQKEIYSNISNLQSNSNIYFPDNYYLINKSGLNFRQCNLTKEEKQRLNDLKNRFKMFLKNNGK